MKTLITTTAILMFSILFHACKKYPENILIFKSPEKAFKGGKITAWKVNGDDSLPMWDRLYSTSPYNGYDHSYNFRNLQFSYGGKENYLFCDLGFGSLLFESNKKTVNISLPMLTVNGYNYDSVTPIFPNSKSPWKILKLTKDGTMVIQKTYNNKNYEIQFN